MLQVDKIILVDDHPLFRQALLGTLQSKLGQCRYLEAQTPQQLSTLLENHNDADLILLDLNLPGSHGFDTLIQVRNQYGHIPVVVVSAYEDPETISKAMTFGASGFIPKSSSPDDIFNAIEQVLNGNIWLPSGFEVTENTDEHNDIAEKVASLTQQQHRILTMFAQGLLNKQIAYELDVSEATIKAHATAIFRKLDVRNRTQAVIAIGQLELTDSFE